MLSYFFSIEKNPHVFMELEDRSGQLVELPAEIPDGPGERGELRRAEDQDLEQLVRHDVAGA
jgi:hypothetical protein